MPFFYETQTFKLFLAWRLPSSNFLLTVLIALLNSGPSSAKADLQTSVRRKLFFSIDSFRMTFSASLSQHVRRLNVTRRIRLSWG
jgi:hypothetical protein